MGARAIPIEEILVDSPFSPPNEKWPPARAAEGRWGLYFAPSIRLVSRSDVPHVASDAGLAESTVCAGRRGGREANMGLGRFVQIRRKGTGHLVELVRKALMVRSSWFVSFLVL